MNKNKNCKNVLQVKCAISGEYIAQGQAICSNIASNNTAYYSKKYNDYFNNVNASDNLINALLTCVVIGGTLQVNESTIKAYKTIDNAIYTITFNNGVKLFCNGSNAQVKKYFNQLKQYKKAIKTITYKDNKNNDIALNNINDYAPYIRQKYLYKIGLSYNPDSKKTIIKQW